eukprot:PhF_6_TR6162/c2_g1_i1/m.9181
MYTVALEWHSTEIPWEVVIPVIVVGFFSLSSLCMLDGARHLTRSYRIATAIVFFTYFLGVWFLYKVAPKSSLRSDTRGVMESELDVGIFRATLENTRAYSCVNLAAYFLRVLFSLCVQRLDYHTLKDDYVLKVSSVVMHSLPVFNIPNKNEAQQEKAKSSSQIIAPLQTTIITTLDGEEEVELYSVDERRSNSNKEEVLVSVNPLQQTDDACELQPNVSSSLTLIAVRGSIEVDSPSAATVIEHSLHEQYPFLDVTTVPLEGGEYEVFVPRMVVRAFGTKSVVPGMQRIWERSSIFAVLMIGAFVGGIVSYAPQLPDKLHLERVTFITAGVVLFAFTLSFFILSQTRSRVFSVFKTFDSIYFISNIILAELCILYVWYNVFPTDLVITRACTTSIVQPIAFIGLDATRNTSRYFKLILMIVLTVVFFIMWFLLRYQDLINDPCCSKYLYDVIEVGVFRASIGSLRMIAYANLVIFYSKYSMSLLFWKREFAMLRVAVDVAT